MRKKNFGLSVWVTILFCSYSFINGEDNDKNRQTFVIRYKDGEQTIPVTVVLDYKKETEYVINMNPRTPAKSVTLYDFKQRTIAYKDLTNQECFLGRLTHETLNEESSALQDLPNPVESKPKMLSLDPGRAALTPTEIRNIAGQKTAVFCRKMNTWLLMPEETHSIGKRDAEEYEERTYHHRGFHTVQFSHYGRETRRRYRNPNGAHKHRPLRKQDVAEGENDSSVVPQVGQPSKGLHLHTGVQDSKADNDINVASSNNLSTNSNPSSQTFGAPHASNHPGHDDIKEASYKNIFTDNLPHSHPHSNRNHFGYQVKYPNFVAEFSSAFGNPKLQPDNNAVADFNTKYIDKSPILDHDRKTEDPANVQLKVNKSQTYISGEGIHTRTERATSTTDVPTAPNSPRINDPLIHSSPVHTIPLHKPLSQEFDFDSPNIPETGASINNQNVNHRHNIESESHPLSTLPIPSYKHRFIDIADDINPSENSDVSTNVLEIPRITKEFENVKGHENYVPQLDNTDQAFKFRTYPERYPYLSQVYANDTPSFPQRNLQREKFLRSEHVPFISKSHASSHESKKLNEENYYIHPSEITTTEFPFLTTPRYFAHRRTSSNNLFSPTDQSAHKTSDDINSLRIIPNRIFNNNFNPTPPKNNLSEHPVLETETKLINKNADAIKENYIFTTAYPLTDNYKQSSSHRSDIPSEDHDKSSFPDQTVTGAGRNIYPSLIPNKTSNEEFSPHRIRYQSVLRDFKPDEIVINIENIPTVSPPPITLGFHQRIFTTIVPTHRSLPADSVRSDLSRTSELTSGTTWQTFIHTTRYPRRRIISTTRKQNEPSLLLQTGLLNQNHHQPSNKIKKHGRTHNFRPAHQSNRRQFDYSRRPNLPSHIRVPTQLNQPLFNQLENLPPGVSVHPRHPQAPYANMIHSNRPPTMPFVDETHTFMKPHRQRHHRVKDQLNNSCCRSHGKSGSSQSCCRNGGPCCSRAHRRTQPPGASCCSSTTDVEKVIPTNQIHHSFRTANRIRPQLRTANHIQPPLRVANQIQLPLRTEEVHRSEINSKDRCEKEKMCRTLYESTQKVMVCRNAHIEGC